MSKMLKQYVWDAEAVYEMLRQYIRDVEAIHQGCWGSMSGMLRLNVRDARGSMSGMLGQYIRDAEAVCQGSGAVCQGC